MGSGCSTALCDWRQAAVLSGAAVFLLAVPAVPVLLLVRHAGGGMPFRLGLWAGGAVVLTWLAWVLFGLARALARDAGRRVR